MSQAVDEETIKRLKKWSNGKKAGPTNMEIFLTERCNLNCKFCGGGPEDKSGEIASKELDWHQWKEILEEASHLGVKSLFISGGEPVVRKDTLLNVIEKTKELGIEGLFVTNGTVLGDEGLKRIVESEWDNIMISLDSAREEIHDYLRNKEGVFEKVKDTISKINEWKEELNKENPNIIITCVINKANYRTLPELAELADKFRVQTIRFQPMIKNPGIMNELALGDEDIDKVNSIVEDIKTLVNEFGLDSNIHEFDDEMLFEDSSEVDKILDEESNENSIPCYQPWYGLKITPMGKVGPCESDFTWESPVNLKDNSLEEVWYGKYFNKIRNMLKNSIPEECSKCCIGKVFEQREIREGLLENDF